MRRIALCTALALLGLAAVPAVAAAPVAKLTVDPNKAGAGVNAVTLDVNPPRPNQNPRTATLRVLRGVKFDPRARPIKCTKDQANGNSCPQRSRIGGGTARATVKSTTGAFAPFEVNIDVNLYLMPPQQEGDLAGVAALFKVRANGQKGHAIGRVTKLSTGPYGLRTGFGDVGGAVKPPAGTTAHLDHAHLVFGGSRTVTNTTTGQSVTYYLLRNPKTCDGTWEYQVRLGYPTGNPVVFNGSGPCRS
jgi:hypothetical protein